jgi:hypothetical protein
MSFTKNVPAAVPSLRHSSLPWTPSSAAKNSTPFIAVKKLGYDDGALGCAPWSGETSSLPHPEQAVGTTSITLNKNSHPALRLIQHPHPAHDYRLNAETKVQPHRAGRGRCDRRESALIRRDGIVIPHRK